MIALGPIAFLRPWWLLAIPAVAAFLFWSRPRGGLMASWEAASDAPLLAAMMARGARSAVRRARLPALFVTVMVGSVALAGPAVRRSDRDRLRNLDATVFVTDASQRMADNGRLRQAASADAALLGHLGAQQAALVVFAGDAYVASAFTDYTAAIETDLFALDDTTVPDPGVRPDKALALAGKLLDEAHIINGDVVLTTSGGGLDGTAAIRAAAALATAGRHVYVMTTAAGTGTGAAAAAAVAAAGNGFVVDAANPERLATTLADRAISTTGSSVVAALAWRDLGRFLLALAAVPLLLGFRKAAAL